MSQNIENKKVIVEEIKAKIQASKSVVLIDYKGLSVAEDTALRNEFRKADVQYKVLKNTLVRKAFNELGVNAFDADLNGTTSIAFGADETQASKIIVDNAKKFDDKLFVKSGFVNGEYVDKAGIEALAKIPSKDALVASLAGTLSNFIRGLAVALNRVAEKQGE
ncbi:MAG: 50S ribosomal protein L10 [Christensenellaceae bacterium]